MQRGHWLDAPRNDYGIDATMFHHNERGEVESGEVRFQIKATNRLVCSRNGRWISQRAMVRDLRYWYFEPYPVILVVYDAKRNRAYWLHVQEYLDRHPSHMETMADSVTLRVPMHNKLNLHAVDRFRKLSLHTVVTFHEYRRGQ